jgi:hypothetical protein
MARVSLRRWLWSQLNPCETEQFRTVHREVQSNTVSRFYVQARVAVPAYHMVRLVTLKDVAVVHVSSRNAGQAHANLARTADVR